MPEEKPPPPSEPPQEPRVTGPTILRPPAGDEPAPAGSAARRPRRLRPTVVAATDAQRSPPVRVAAPTAITGAERKRIPVRLDDLRSLSPGTKADVLARALRLLQGYVAEDATDGTVVLWGHRLQQDYADLVSETLARSQADVLTRVTVHLNRMMELLGSIDLMAVAGAADDRVGLEKYLGRLSKRIDTREELRTARVEIDQLVKLIGAAMDELLDLKAEVDRSSGRIDEIGDEVEASALAAQFLSTYLQRTDEGLSRRLLERSMSLTQTALQIRGSASMRESQIEQPLRLIAAIQNVALVMVPGFLGSIASLTALRGRKPTPTEADEMAFQLRKILEQLQT
jgi:hypothetical protein